MSSKATSIKRAVADFMTRHGVSGEMEQNLIKEAIHLHLLSALSDAGVLRHVVFHGGTALRLCYGGERYSEDLDFVCGTAGAYLDAIELESIVRNALDTTRRTLSRDFDVDPDRISLVHPARPLATLKSRAVSVASWQIAVPIEPTPRSPRSRIKIELANVPSYDNAPDVAKIPQGLVQIQDVILRVESANEILADKAVALTARPALKYRDVWDAWYLVNRLSARADRGIVARKLADHGVTDIPARAEQRRDELARGTTARAFLDEIKRFLPARRVAEITTADLHRTILAASSELIGRVVLPSARDGHTA